MFLIVAAVFPHPSFTMAGRFGASFTEEDVMRFRNIAVNLATGRIEDQSEAFYNIRQFARREGIAKAGALYLNYLKSEAA